MQCWHDLQREHARQELAQLQAVGVAAAAVWGGDKAGRAYERRQDALLRLIRGSD